jgi:hypothetical protein
VLSQAILDRTENQGTIDRPEKKAANFPNLTESFVAWPALCGKKKERRRKSGRLPSMSLSEEGSFVFCIDRHDGNGSIYLRPPDEEKANWRQTRPLDLQSRNEGTLQLWP